MTDRVAEALGLVRERSVDNFRGVRLRPYNHQVVGVEQLVRLDDPTRGRVIPGCLYIADECGAGKTKQVIDAAQALYVLDSLDRVIIVGPGDARTTWFNPDPAMGQVARYAWAGLPMCVFDYHQRVRKWALGGPSEGSRYLRWVFTTYSFMRSRPRLEHMLQFCTQRTLLVLDESSEIQNRSAVQTKAVMAMRKRCGRVVELNGTPLGSGSPEDMFSQSAILAPWPRPSGRGFGGSRILQCRDFMDFQVQLCQMGGWIVRGRPVNIVGWRNLDVLEARMAPYTLRRLKRDCLDLPERLPPVAIEVPLGEESWRVYREMRSQMVAELSGGSELAVAVHGGARVLRLAQVCAGLIGGVEDIETEERMPLRILGREKLDAALRWVAQRLADNPSEKLVLWTRFNTEMDRLVEELRALYPRVPVGVIRGGQEPEERDAAARLMKPGACPEGPAVVVANPKAGSMSLDFAACAFMLHVSNGTKLRDRLQADERPDRPGQTRKIWTGDLVATGPRGQRTVDHGLLRRMWEKRDMANAVSSEWVSVVMGDDEEGVA